MAQKQYKPFPLHPLLVPLFASQQGVSEEQVLQPENIRAGFNFQAAQRLAEYPLPSVSRVTQTITGGPKNVSVSVTILRPVGSENTILPCILYLHGGGWAFGSMDTHGALVYELAHQVPACVIFVDYSMSPEAQYPTALEESYAALCWATENAAKLRINPKQIAMGGDSAGGNLTAAVTLLAKERGNKSITFQFLYYPVLDDDFNRESYLKFKDSNAVSRHVMMHVWDAYSPSETPRNNILITPCKATTEQLRNLPPALILTAEYDTLRDEAEQYAKQLIKAGVETVPARYIGVQHGFLTALPFRSQANAAISQTVFHLREAWAKNESKL